MATVYLGLGSNLGDRQKNIQTAITKLEECDVRIEKTSSIIETDPVGGPPQGKYLNAVVKVTTNHAPRDLLRITQSIEQALGRRRTVPNGPRTLDIDILLYDQKKIQSDTLIIPHPRMLERDFVLEPLREIDPHLVKEFCNANCF